ncbi:MAG: Na+/H+ antiporter subunit E [Desulfomonilaceae bacterium]|nr:Na+/H+ antiporter subunit E [Desulfomonilaceae bacterium]
MEKDAAQQLKRDLPPQREWKKSGSAYIATFIIMMGVWCVLSGQFDLFHLGLGVLASALVSYYSADLLFDGPMTGKTFRTTFGFLAYVPWLLYQILLSALHVLYLCFHPRMPELIDPQIYRFRTRLKSDLAQVTFANSITLTPGTITIYVNFHRDFNVHAIDPFSGEDLPGEMERRIARAFGEE